MASNFTTGGSDAVCFTNALQAAYPYQSDASNCSIGTNLLLSLNLTDFKSFFSAYCANPPDDNCPYGFCPNSDIAGPLVRISAYLTNVLVAILIFHDPEEVKDSFWAQILNVYSLLLACAIAIFKVNLTRIHAILTTAIAGSPLSLYISIYALRSIWRGEHRLSAAVGRGRIIPRTIVLTGMAAWIGLVVYIILPSHLSHFSQQSCERSPVYDSDHGPSLVQLFTEFYFLLPAMMLVGFGEISAWVPVILTMPVSLTIVSWIVAILRKRRDIWLRGERYRPRFKTVWRTIRKNYPFLYFMSIIILPFTYWIASIEVMVIVTSIRDDTFSASFGQVLAIFVTIPPMISVAKLFPNTLEWFINLTWVRLFTCRSQRKKASTTSPPFTSSQESLAASGYEKAMMEDHILGV